MTLHPPPQTSFLGAPSVHCGGLRKEVEIESPASGVRDEVAPVDAAPRPALRIGQKPCHSGFVPLARWCLRVAPHSNHAIVTSGVTVATKGRPGVEQKDQRPLRNLCDIQNPRALCAIFGQPKLGQDLANESIPVLAGWRMLSYEELIVDRVQEAPAASVRSKPPTVEVPVTCEIARPSVSLPETAAEIRSRATGRVRHLRARSQRVALPARGR